jgi:glycosyltransferase involved in cell wall biosynthesis
MSRIYVNHYDDFGCGYYRCALPVYQCFGDLSKKGAYLQLQRELHSEENNFDAYVFHRIPQETAIFFLQKIQDRGKKFVLELDDDLYSIPEWMPSEEYKNTKWALNKALDVANEIWVSTPKLAETINRPGKVHVLPNLVDTNAFLRPKPTNAPIRIMWMGSCWHDKDLEQLVDPVERLIAEYGDAVQFLFWGCLPEGFSDYEKIPGQNVATLRQKAKYGTQLLYLDGVQFKHYYDRLVGVGPTIGLCPLYDCKFNHSKSNLKFLEYSMGGAVTVATKLPPYDCINDGEDGLLVSPGDSDGWYHAIKKLIDNPALRTSMVENARQKVYEQYSWQSPGKKDLWLDAFNRII